MNVCAFTSVCKEDIWLASQYLKEVQRLGMKFYIHLDRVTPEQAFLFLSHPLCAGHTEQPDTSVEFTEQHKQRVFDLACGSGAGWLMAWDVDEIFEKNARSKLKLLDGSDADHAQVTWLNLWDDADHVRIDGPFHSPPRVKFYNVKRGLTWLFDHPITNGAKAFRGGVPAPVTLAHTGIVCLHTGFMTEQLRRIHKERWDRIYTKAVGANPYKIWDHVLNEAEHPPTVIRHGYR